MSYGHLRFIKSLHPLIFLLLVTIQGYAQDKYWVFFTDKDNTGFDPYSYFDQKAIERRIKHHYPLDHYSDWPVNEEYICSTENVVDSVGGISRWFNAVAVYARPKQMEALNKLPFVKEVEIMNSHIRLASMKVSSTMSPATEGTGIDTLLSDSQLELLIKQTERFGNAFDSADFNGKGIRIAVFDAGFPAVDIHPAFEHIRKENRIIKTYDFVRKKENVYAKNHHGTMVLSCIAGKMGEYKTGLATDAEFLLARTEIGSREPFAEEEYWMEAMEWADRNGADIINSSLAYTFHRYFDFHMDGKKSLVAKAANMAAAKGMLVINAAGNDGDNKWKVIGTPADADSVMTVGGISPFSDYHIDFSSFGPTSDKRMKPNVVAYGKAVVANKKGITTAYGTSFAAPLIAGFAACAWQSDSTRRNMELFRAIEESGELYPYFDYAHGFGVPNSAYFVNKKNAGTDPTFEIEETNFTIKINVHEQFVSSEIFNNLTEVFDTVDKQPYLFYHIENKKGFLSEYYVLEVQQQDVLTLYKEDFEKGEKLRVHYRGYTKGFEF